MNDETMELLEHLFTFTDERVYILAAIARSKDEIEEGLKNKDVESDEPTIIRKIVENEDEISDKLEQLKRACAHQRKKYRLYATVNGRNAREAQYYLQEELLKAENEARKSGEVPHITKRIDHKWKSILQEPRTRDEKRFLWDIDTSSEEARDKMQELLDGMTILTQETPNGWHIVTVPFDFTDLDIPDWIEVERKNDDMVCVSTCEMTIPFHSV